MMSALDRAPKLRRHRLLAIADAEHWYAGVEDLLRRKRCILVEHRGRAAGENHCCRFYPCESFRRLLKRHDRSEEHTSELQSRQYLVCRLLLEKKKQPPWSVHASATMLPSILPPRSPPMPRSSRRYTVAASSHITRSERAHINPVCFWDQ